MKYHILIWMQSDELTPIVIMSEVNRNGEVKRIIEYFLNGTINKQCASDLGVTNIAHGPADLEGYEPDKNMKLFSISKELFEQAWG